MFVLKKMITSFLVPPGFFVLILLLLGVWLRRRRKRGLASIHFTLALVFWALSLNPVAQTLTSRLEAGLTIPSPIQGDVIILLGGGIHEGVADLTGRGMPSEDMLARMVTAIRLQRRLNIPIIVSGGSGYVGRSPEAPVVRRVLVDLGVDDRQILVETKSRDTEENALYCREILNERGFRRPLLVTSVYHMRRSITMFHKVGVAVTPVPAQFATSGALPLIWVDFLPSPDALLQSAKALKEYIGLLYYRIM
jgi:uncharacterized SAM-binding protein YcdF (DUF218 family)